MTTIAQVQVTRRADPDNTDIIVFEIEHQDRTHAVAFTPTKESRMIEGARGAFARATGLPSESFVFPANPHTP